MAKAAATRRRGYSLVEGCIIPGMNAVGVPILGTDGRRSPPQSGRDHRQAVGSSVAWPARLLAREAAELGQAMVHVTAFVSLVNCWMAPRAADK